MESYQNKQESDSFAAVDILTSSAWLLDTSYKNNITSYSFAERGVPVIPLRFEQTTNKDNFALQKNMFLTSVAHG